MVRIHQPGQRHMAGQINDTIGVRSSQLIVRADCLDDIVADQHRGIIYLA